MEIEDVRSEITLSNGLHPSCMRLLEDPERACAEPVESVEGQAPGHRLEAGATLRQAGRLRYVEREAAARDASQTLSLDKTRHSGQTPLGSPIPERSFTTDFTDDTDTDAEMGSECWLRTISAIREIRGEIPLLLRGEVQSNPRSSA